MKFHSKVFTDLLDYLFRKFPFNPWLYNMLFKRHPVTVFSVINSTFSNKILSANNNLTLKKSQCYFRLPVKFS